MAKQTESTNGYQLTTMRLARVDQIPNVNDRGRHTTMRLVIYEDGAVGAVTEDEARQKEEQMKEEANPQALRFR